MERSAAFATDSPDIGALQEQFAQCSPVSRGWHRIDDNDDIRYQWWDSQSSDGKKWDVNQPEGKPAFPFDGASDCKIPLADELINDQVDVLTEAFHRSAARVSGNPETESTGKTARVRKLMEWMRGTKLYGEMAEEVELLAQYGLTYGAAVMEVGWERQLGYRNHVFSMEMLLGAAQQAREIRVKKTIRAAVEARASLRAGPVGNGMPMVPMAAQRPSIIEMFPAMIQDPALDNESAKVLQKIYAAYCEGQKTSNFDYEVKELSLARARKAIGELREDGEAKLPLPYLCKDKPYLRARKMWEDVFIPEYAAKVQESPAVFLVDWFSEAELRAMAETEEWNQRWVNEAVKHKGEFSAFTSNYSLNNGQRYKAASLGYTEQDKSELVEVITCFRKLVDEDGVLGVYKTVFHGNFGAKSQDKDVFAWHGLNEDPIGLNYPLVQWRREVNARSLCASRGVPQIVNTDQRKVKVQEDAVTDRTSFETLPPILVPAKSGVDYRFNPAGQIPVTRMDMKPEFMQPPKSSPGTSEWLVDRIERRQDRYFGRRRADEPPENSLIKKQKLVRSFLVACSEICQFQFQMMAVNMPPEKIQRITGSTEPLASSVEIEEETAFLLAFDTQEFSPEFIEVKLKAVSEIAASDPSGTIDQAKLTRYKLRAIDPNLELELTTDVQGAAGQVLKQVKDDFVNMHNGVPAHYTENDPTSGMQVSYAQQLIQTSPTYQISLKQDPRFQELVMEWFKNKKFSLDQMANKQIGRIGVDPRGDGG